MKRTLLLTLCAAAMTAAGIGTAFAGSPTPAVEEPPVIVPAAAPEIWDGAYVGATFGSRAGGDMTYTPGPSYASLEPGQSAGLFGGYNFQNGNMVYGGELAYSRVNAPGFGAVGFPGETFDYFFDAKLRAGVAMDNVLLYGFAGFSSSTYDDTFSFWNVSGANYGLGMDIKMGDNFFAGAEYIIRNLSGDTNNPGQVQDTTIQALQLRAGWKF